ncbi:hypothetical protein [Sphingomonas sp. Leaf10]|uniref:hypothetical protein n=1 Tax=Sphingomonas sp. Leaf10 TaxID=1735676 RepID=UPI000712E08F|nr:hypothetical protein [Sphingomonas sp. Leaf10]KQM41227.1 hypothetical protein ASE59_02800 [Sphingomonas sp. Leaf10]
MGMVGPSTIAHNNYATNTASILRGGNNAAGPISNLNATSPYRVQVINDFDTSNTKLYYGDNAAIGGLDFDAWPAQIEYLATRLAGVPAAKRWLNYELGRNGISRSLSEHKAALDRDIANARSKGFSKIFLNKLWFRTSSTSGWEKGSANRQKIVDINAYIDQLVAAATDLVIVDLPVFMHDPSTGSGLNVEPYSDAVRNDGQHISSRGGRRASKAYEAAVAPFVVAKTFPTPASENKIPAMAGSGGALGPATGEVYSGFTLAAAGSAITTVASRVTNGGKPYQRLAFSGMSYIGSSGASIEMRSDGFAATAGERVNWRCKVRIPATQNPYMFYAALEGGSNTTGARSVAFAPARTDLSTDEVVTTTGTTLTSGSVFNGAADTEDREFWLEGTLPIHVDVDSPLTVVVRFLLRASAVDFVAEIGEFQTFNWAG